MERLLASNDVMGILGDGRDLSVLDEANVDECDSFIAMTFNDDVNLISSMIAKKKGAKSTIVRPVSYTHLCWVKSHNERNPYR